MLLQKIISKLGESLPTAVKREVLEETGIETKFVSLVSARHMQPQGDVHRGTFSCSDFYFVAYLKPIGGTEIFMCTRELENARWMKVFIFIADFGVIITLQSFINAVGRVRRSSASPLEQPTTSQTINSNNWQKWAHTTHRLP